MSCPNARSYGIGTLAMLGFGVAATISAFRLLPASTSTQQPPITTRVSVDSAGGQANGESAGPSCSSDAGSIAFVSWATNLVPGDTNDAADVFLKDLATGMIVRPSVATSGAQADGDCFAPSISGDGRLVAFTSEATNLVPGDSNEARDVFVRDLQAGTTIRASVGLAGDQGDAASYGASMSADGRFVAFTSLAKNLVGEDTNGESDVFVRDLQTGALERISVGPGGAAAAGSSEGASISADGRFVAFASTAANLIPAESGADTNRAWDVFVRDRSAGTNSRASVATNGGQADGHSWTPSLSGDGRYVAFASFATNLVAGDANDASDILLHDTLSATTTRVSIGPNGVEGNAASSHPALSADGRWIAFCSDSENLVAGDSNGRPDVFLHNRDGQLTIRVSISSSGDGGNGRGAWPSISADGRFVAFPCAATNLSIADSNGAPDIFVRGPLH